MSDNAAPVQPWHMRRNGFDPIPELGRARDDEGVVRIDTAFGEPMYLITRYDDVRDVLADPALFRTEQERVFMVLNSPKLSEEQFAELKAGNPIAFDGPDHARLRRILAPEFSGHRIRRLQPRIVEIIDDHLDELERAGSPADLLDRFALPVPSLVICELLGVPYADRADFQRRTRDQLDVSLPLEERLALGKESREYMGELVARAQASPGEDLIGMLVRRHSHEMSTQELTGIAALLLVSGHATTASMIGLGTLALLRNPDQLALVRDDPDAVVPAVEELMRWLTVVHTGVPRSAVTDVEIAGHHIPAGALILLGLSIANRDPALVDDAERLDVTRPASRHLSFGHGIHRCLGAPLARMEMAIGYPALLRRFPDLRLAVPDDEVEFNPFHTVFGLRSLPVTW